MGEMVGCEAGDQETYTLSCASDGFAYALPDSGDGVADGILGMSMSVSVSMVSRVLGMVSGCRKATPQGIKWLRGWISTPKRIKEMAGRIEEDRTYSDSADSAAHGLGKPAQKASWTWKKRQCLDYSTSYSCGNEA